MNKMDTLIAAGTRIVVALEKLTGIESRNADSEIISQERSKEERTETERIDKGKGREIIKEVEEDQGSTMVIKEFKKNCQMGGIEESEGVINERSIPSMYFTRGRKQI